MMKWTGGCVLVLLAASIAMGQTSPPRSDDNPPPRSDVPQGESSSKSTKVDLSPPPGEPDFRTSSPASDVQEFHPWDPHKADKNVEIGDFYFKRKNYRAAISRYREALYWMSNHAIATYKLAQALEEVGDYNEARKCYQGYLKILPKGEFAADSQKAIDRLKDKPDEKKAGG